MNGYMVILLGLSFFALYKLSVGICTNYLSLEDINDHKTGVTRFFTKVLYKYAYTGAAAMFPIIGLFVVASGCGILAMG